MSAFRPESYAEALSLAQNRPQRRRSALRSTSSIRSPNARQGETGARKTASGIKRRPSSAIPYGTNSLRAKKKGKRKKLTDGQLKKKVWVQFSIFIRTRGADENGFNRCVTCNGGPWYWKDLQAGHFLRGRLNANLFNELGVWPQCYGCNVGRDGNVVEYYEWMLANHGKAVIDELRHRNNVTHKWEPGELVGLLDKYKTLNAANHLVKEQL